MSSAEYKVKFYSGDYPERQRAANQDRAICYVEQHFNCSDNPNVNYALAVVATNASSRSQEWGRKYAADVAAKFGIGNSGVSIGGFGGRGNANLKYTDMPAILLEPMFISNPQGSQWAETRSDDLAAILVATIKDFFPNGGLVAFSIGHVGKRSNPSDRGAQAVSGKWEADLARVVLKEAEERLVHAAPAPAPAEEDHPIPADEVSDWAREAQAWAKAQGFTDGLRPKAPVTREELWTMAFRAFGKKDN